MIKLKKILVPTDLSDYSSHALAYAVELASAYGATLHLLHVVDAQWAWPAGSADFPGQIGDHLYDLQKSAQEQLEELKESIEGIEVVESAVMGTPHVEIVRFAREEGVDLIVLATHGRTGIPHVLIGSVAEKMVQMAPCPVLTVHHPEHEFVLP